MLESIISKYAQVKQPVLPVSDAIEKHLAEHERDTINAVDEQPIEEVKNTYPEMEDVIPQVEEEKNKESQTMDSDVKLKEVLLRLIALLDHESLGVPVAKVIVKQLGAEAIRTSIANSRIPFLTLPRSVSTQLAGDDEEPKRKDANKHNAKIRYVTNDISLSETYVLRGNSLYHAPLIPVDYVGTLRSIVEEINDLLSPRERM